MYRVGKDVEKCKMSQIAVEYPRLLLEKFYILF